MEDVNWLEEPNGFIKIIALMLSVACACFLLVHGENFFPFNDGFIVRLSILTLSSNIGVLTWFLVSYTFDHNVGFAAFTETVYGSVSACSNFVLAILNVNYCGTHAITGNWFGVMESIIFTLMLFNLSLIFFMDVMCYVVGSRSSPDREMRRIYIAR